MATFDTPEAITAVIELVMADVRVVATDRDDTTVEVRPSDSTRRADVQAAEQTRVDYSGGRLLVKATGRWRSWSPFGDGGSVDVEVGLPLGSRVTGTTAGAFRCVGALGDCEIKTSLGEIQIERAAAVRLATSAGDITLEHATGDAHLTTGSGAIRVGEIDGSAVIKNSNGDTSVREVGGELQVKAANGDIAIDDVRGTVATKTANGDIRVGRPRAARSLPRPRSARSRSRSPTEPPPGSTCTRSTASSTTTSRPADRPDRTMTASRCAPAPATATSPSGASRIISNRSTREATMSTTPAIEVHGLRKVFGDVVARDGLDLEVDVI